ncbi:dihydrofolate reductase [Novosphingobium marinum]|uniref:Dihydrofolate reductase n=1 Tax=Novosphingobium marinum TaxID=1514948 RepID=A0A7Y9XWB6_9SPHN|nr:dihydrofolate reductase [Novosphingobium marinum]NYH95727.1 dihydrofolate reductase [Novosphingobium marinum]GGC29358.1 dihydrofolate reductase [Novosphingobium marinum]
MSAELFLIFARAANGTIGRDNAMPWHLPVDLKRFKRLTMGAYGTGLPMIMGRKTFESLGKPLPGRRHIVLTRDREWQADGAEPVHSVGEALERAGQGEVAVIGGAQIYDLFEPLARRIELTEVHADYEGDAHLPAIGGQWTETMREDHPADGDRPAFSFVTLVRSL